MSKFILVSFCNLPIPSIYPMLCVEIPNNLKEPINFSPVSLGYSESMINDVRGLSYSAGKVFALFSRVVSDKREFFVAILEQNDLTPSFCQKLPDIVDGHSILATENNLYVVSTGTDEIFCYDLLEGEIGNPRVIWQASASRSDTHHVNSIAKSGGDLFVSAFGQKTGLLWATASNGYIHNITHDTRAKEGIYHPHSLIEKRGQLYYCNSSRRTFCSMDGPLFELNGYTRGGGWLTDELVCIASSVGRRVSKSTGLISNPADPGDLAGTSSLILGNITDRKIVSRIDLSWFGNEIYDVLVLDTKINLSNLIRLSKLAEIEQIQVLLAQTASKDQKIRILETQMLEVYKSRTWRLIQYFRKIRSSIIKKTLD